MWPLVSVIVPTYNRADYLKLALKSILEQTYKNIEVIVVDDGSTDNTAEVIASLSNQQIKYLKQNHVGLPSTGRNIGLKVASGDYIAFCDDDDLWVPEKIEKQVDYLNKHQECHLVYSNAWVINETGVQKGLLIKQKSLKKGDIFEELMWEPTNFIPQLTVLMKREIFEDIGFFNEDPTLRFVEDYEYWLRVALRYKIGFVEEPLAMYRIHSQRESPNVNYGKLRQKVLSSFINEPLVPNKNKIIERIYGLYYESAFFNWKNSDRVTAKEDLKKYLSYNLQHMHIINLSKALFLRVLLNFDYNRLKNIKDRLLR